MLNEILDETLDRLAEFEKQNPSERIIKQDLYTSLKSQIRLFQNFCVLEMKIGK